MDPKLKFTIVASVIAFASFYLFKYLHVWINDLVLKKQPHFKDKFPWVFTTRSHAYVFLIMLLKLGIVIALIWLDLIVVPKILQS